jgi:carbon storage regulator
MLVFSRRVNQEIMIGDNISVMVIEIRGDKVRLGVQAPANIPVHRHEVHEATQKEKLDTITYDPTIGEDYA